MAQYRLFFIYKWHGGNPYRKKYWILVASRYVDVGRSYYVVCQNVGMHDMLIFKRVLKGLKMHTLWASHRCSLTKPNNCLKSIFRSVTYSEALIRY